MTTFLLKRLGSLLVVLLVLTAVIFVLQQVSPGDPARAALGANASTQAVAQERERLGLNDPLPQQYLRFVGHAMRGDFGTSYRTHRPVAKDLSTALPATLELVLAAFALALAMAMAFAATGVLRMPGGGLYRAGVLLGATAPPFLLAIGGLVLFYSELGWLPASGRGSGGLGSYVSHLVLPAAVLAAAPTLAIGRILRSSIAATLSADHIRTARSKGLGEAQVFASHVVRNSVGPALSMAGLQLGFMFAGDVVVEQIFSWPGMGNYLANSIPTSDFPAIAAVTLVLGVIYVGANAAADLLQARADPRIE